MVDDKTVNTILATRTSLVLGSAGAGKTSLAAYIAAGSMNRGLRNLFVRLGSWAPGETIGQLLNRFAGHSSGPDGTPSFDVLVLDAVDESRLDTLSDAFDQIVELASGLSSTRLIVTCRTGGVPSWTLGEFDEIVDLMPLPDEEVKNSVGRLLPKYVTRDPLLEREVIEVCRNPLMLALTMRIGSTEEGRLRLQRVRSRSQLILLYAELAIDREATMRRLETGRFRFLSRGLAKRLLIRLAFWLSESSATSITDSDLEVACAEWLKQGDLSSFLGENRPTASELAVAVRSLPLLTVSSGEIAPSEVQFAHLSFRDVLGAVDDRASTDYVSLSEKREAWSAIVIRSGLAERPGIVSRQIIDYGTEQRKQECFTLAAQCVSERWDEQGTTVDDLVLRILDAFKNWGRPFDYELMRAASSLSTRLSPTCPLRLSEDLKYFADKYAPLPLEMIYTDTPERLTEYLSATDPQLRLDALYSIPIYVSRGQLDAVDACGKIWLHTHRAENPPELEVAVASLKSLAENSPEIVRTVAPGLAAQIGPISQRSWRAAAFALNALAYIGDATDISLIGEYLLHPENRYRDSASWSLLILTRRLRDRFPDIRNTVVSYYSQALVGVRNIAFDNKAIGNVLYSIGALGFWELHHLVQQYCRSESAYVREDAVYALGLLGDQSAASLLEAVIVDGDPGVRLKCVEAATVIRSPELAKLLRRVATAEEELAYIKMMAGHALNAYEPIDDWRPTVRALLGRRRPRDGRTFIVGPFDETERDLIRTLLSKVVTSGVHGPDYSERTVDMGTEFIIARKMVNAAEAILSGDQ